MNRPKTPAELRFFRFVVFADRWYEGTRCLEWTGKRSQGYGRFGDVGAHRWLYERWIGPIPKMLELDHLCRNRACVNPIHVEPVTHAENMRRSTGLNPRPRQAACHRGHAFTPANTYCAPGSSRRNCRACGLEATRRYQRRRAVQAG